MGKIITTLITAIISLDVAHYAFSENTYKNTNENMVSEVLNNYYKEFNDLNSTKKGGAITPNVFQTDTTLANYYAQFLK